MVFEVFLCYTVVWHKAFLFIYKQPFVIFHQKFSILHPKQCLDKNIADMPCIDATITFFEEYSLPLSDLPYNFYLASQMGSAVDYA